MKIGMVMYGSQIDDGSFNQSAWDGIRRAEQSLGAQARYVEAVDAADAARQIDRYAAGGYDVVVSVGFPLTEVTAAAARTYPEIAFIGVDQAQSQPQRNLAGLVFPEDQAGYLAGALAALTTRKGIVGQVLGPPEVPSVEAFGTGFLNGARETKPGIRVLTTCNPNGPGRGFADDAWGRRAALQLTGQGADVVFAAAGSTGNAALETIAARPDQSVLGIGVDTDQYFTLPTAAPILVSSAMKMVTPGVFGLIRDAHDGTFEGGNQMGGVILAPYHDQAGRVSPEAKQQLDQLDNRVAEGTLKTGWTGPTGKCPA